MKVKKDYIAGMTDTLDLVPIGAFYGKVCVREIERVGGWWSQGALSVCAVDLLDAKAHQAPLPTS